MTAGSVYTQSREPFIHQALFYASDDEFLSTTGRFVRDGLDADERVMAVTTRHNIDLLRGHLGATAQVEYIDADTWYLGPGATLGAYFRRLGEHRGPGRLRVIGEPVWHGRAPLEVSEWMRYESVLNSSLTGMPGWVLCPYNTRALPDEILSDVSRTHPEVVGGALTWTSLVYREPAEFSATRDAASLPAPGGHVVEQIITPERLLEAREFVTRHARDHDLPDQRVLELVLAVNEVVTNVLDHGAGRGVVRIWHDGSYLICDVVDQADTLTNSLQGYSYPSPRTDRGLGLWVVRQLCDLVEIRQHPDGSVVRLRMATSA